MLGSAFVRSHSRTVLAVAVLTAFLLLLYRLLFRKRSLLPLPPGPAGRFLVGNLGQINLDRPEEDYIRWGKQYDSDVIHIQILGQHMICLNSVEAANHLLDKRGSNYSDRPRFTLFEVMGWGLTLTFLPWGPQFKLHRSLFQKTFTQSNVKSFREIQLHEARKAARFLVAKPQDWESITLLLTTSIIFRIAFGQEIPDRDSPYCALSAAAHDATTSGGIAGTSLVDVFPLARFLPEFLNPSRALRHARRSRSAIEAVREVPWRASLAEIEAGTAPPSFMRTHLEKLRAGEEAGGPREMTVADVKGATSTVFIAGGNTTWSTILSCMLFLTKYPDVQRRVQAEIDEAIRADRLPAFDDLADLPYLNRFTNEVMRVLPLNPLVIPHKSLRDDEYRGMRIPGGSVVFANAKAMNLDRATYRDPDVFDPDRYLRGEPYPAGNFGFGRRKCPGNFLALASVDIFLATLMAVFRLEKVVGPDGKIREPEPGLTVGLGGHPEPFECKLEVRSPLRAQLVRGEH